MFEELEARQRRFAAYLPLSAENLRRLDLVFEPLFIHGSNAIEGNTLSLGDTTYLIREGRLPGGKREEEYLEVKGQQKAYAYLRQAVQTEFTLSEKLIREFHQLLTEPLDLEKYRPGQYKDRDNKVRLADGSEFPYVSHVDTPAAMQELVAWFNGPGQALHAVERAAQLHYKFILIHPFRDGNGRSARLLANFALLRAGHVLTVFRADERRPDYLRALHAVDVSVPRQELAPGHPGLNFFPFVSHVEQELLWSYDRTLDVLEGKVPLEPDDIVRRFESLESRAIEALSVPPDEAARLARESEGVRSLTELVASLANSVAAKLNATWGELSVRVGQVVQDARVLLRRPRYAVLAVPPGQMRGVAGLVELLIAPKEPAAARLRLPDGVLNFIVRSEPHALRLSALRTGNIFDTPTVVTGGSHLPIDTTAWRRHEIERFVLGALDLYFEDVRVEIEAINRPPSG